MNIYGKLLGEKVNIFDYEWCDILFIGRNKEYGAYQTRKESSKRHAYAIVITIVIALVGIFAPKAIKSVMPKKEVRNVEVTALSSLQIEQKKIDPVKEIKVEEIKPVKATIRFTPPVIKADAEVSDTQVMKTVDELNVSKASISTADQQGVFDDPDAVDVGELNQIVEDTASAPLLVVEQMPSYPGGDNELRKYLAEHIRYPDMARENGIQGRVYVQFVVNTKGKITNAVVVRGIDPSCDKEALRVVNTMPSWSPGRQNGMPVRVQFTIPINFVLN
jgi:periplasmic protein TonB